MAEVNNPTCACGRPVADQAYACAGCGDKMLDALRQVPALAVELDVTLTRQARISAASGTAPRMEPYEPLSYVTDPITGKEVPAGTSAKVSPMPFDYAASEALDVLRSALVGAVRLVHEERGADLPADHLGAMALWLIGHGEWLRHHEAAGELIDELVVPIAVGLSVIDRPADRVYAGACGDDSDAWKVTAVAMGSSADFCPGELYAHEGSWTVACEVCGLVYNVAERREWLRDAAEDQLATLRDLSAFLSDDRTPTERVRNMLHGYHQRGRLMPHGMSMLGKPTFRVGDARALLHEAAVRDAEKAGRRRA